MDLPFLIDVEDNFRDLDLKDGLDAYIKKRRHIILQKTTI
jgi:hypothetical protein